MRKWILSLIVLTLASAAAAEPMRNPPRVQVLPLPKHEASFQIDGKEITRLYFDKQQERLFLYPVNGPAGRSLTRMGHPHDPVSHSHHNSVWLSHHDVNGIDFWSDRRHGVIEFQRVIKYDDSDREASMSALFHWKATGLGKDKDGKPQAARVVMVERRKITLQPLEGGESLIIIDTQLHAPGSPGKDNVTLNPTPFGLIGVRMAKNIGVADGGGVIRNSEGHINETGDNGCFRKPAKWCDYTGYITREKIEGITLFDHPSNINHPAPFHVRVDGWMGACLTLDKAITIAPDKPLRLRYGLYVHGYHAKPEPIEERWKAFAKTEVKELAEK